MTRGRGSRPLECPPDPVAWTSLGLALDARGTLVLAATCAPSATTAAVLAAAVLAAAAAVMNAGAALAQPVSSASPATAVQTTATSEEEIPFRVGNWAWVTQLAAAVVAAMPPKLMATVGAVTSPTATVGVANAVVCHHQEPTAVATAVEDTLAAGVSAAAAAAVVAAAAIAAAAAVDGIAAPVATAALVAAAAAAAHTVAMVAAEAATAGVAAMLAASTRQDSYFAQTCPRTKKSELLEVSLTELKQPARSWKHNFRMERPREVAAAGSGAGLGTCPGS